MTDNELHFAIDKAVHDVRQRLQAENIGGSFRLDIEISGLIQTGEVKCTYRLDHQYNTSSAKGARLSPVVEEFVRRHGWEKRNAPDALSPPEAYATPDRPPEAPLASEDEPALAVEPPVAQPDDMPF